MRYLSVLLLSFLSLPSYGAREGDKSLGWPGNTLNGAPCYGTKQGFGPFDYTNKRNWTERRLFVVERDHFPPESENLTGRGAVVKSTDPEKGLAADFDYTLKAFPNHHRALWSMVRLFLQNRNNYTKEERIFQEKKRQPPTRPECYLQRAMAFAPEDPVPAYIYAIYLHKAGRLNDSLARYEEVEKRMPRNAEVTYNIGLLYFDLKQYEKAELYAQRAKELGFPLSGLMKKLEVVKLPRRKSQ